MLTKSRHPPEGLFTVFCRSATWRRPIFAQFLLLIILIIKENRGLHYLTRPARTFFDFYYLKHQKVVLKEKNNKQNRRHVPSPASLPHEVALELNIDG